MPRARRPRRTTFLRFWMREARRTGKGRNMLVCVRRGVFLEGGMGGVGSGEEEEERETYTTTSKVMVREEVVV